MSRSPAGRGGVALVVAIAGVVVIAMLTSGALMMAFHERRAAHADIRRLQAFLAAEEGLGHIMTTWTEARYLTIDQGDYRALARWTDDSAGWYHAVVRRLGKYTYLVAVEGFSGDSAARQHLGRLLTAAWPDSSIGAAMSVSGAIRFQSGVLVSGVDVTPPAWHECGTFFDVVGVLVRDSTTLLLDGATVVGDPAIRSSPGHASLKWLEVEGFERSADYLLDGGIFEPQGRMLPWDTCEAAEVTWHTDEVRCRGELPISVVGGGAHFRDQVVRGVLVVNGDLQVSGRFELYGVLVVRGRLVTGPQYRAHGRIWGGIIVEDKQNLGSRLTGDWAVRYSSCTVRRALARLMVVQAPRERSWANLY